MADHAPPEQLDAKERKALRGTGEDSSSPVVMWVDKLLARAAAEGVSDVHFMTQESGRLLVRFRQDGLLRQQPMSLKGREGEIIGTLLTRCPTIDPADKTRPQDGTFWFKDPQGRRIDTRLAMIPLVSGTIEIVVRLLDPRNIRRRLDDMGFDPADLVKMRSVTGNPQGLVLVVGPTGSGKSTTLYGLLNELDAQTLHILTAEDPVEYRLPGIAQTQIRSDLGAKSFTFAQALRAFLRLDPDIILVGEIRDAETAEVAMHAALTGHLVLSTLHSNSALGIFQRLEELGVEPFMIAESLSMAVSQRLLRKLHICKTLDEPTAAEVAFLQRMNLEVPEIIAHAKPNGCNGCSGVGYKGRIPVLESLIPTPKVKELIATKSPIAKIQEVALAEGSWHSILTDAHRHVLDHTTSTQEILRVLNTSVE